MEMTKERLEMYRSNRDELEAEQDCIEEWVFGIRDSRTRRIFQMYFLEGLTQEKVGRKMNMDRSVVSRKIDSYLKFAHKTQKTHL